MSHDGPMIVHHTNERLHQLHCSLTPGGFAQYLSPQWDRYTGHPTDTLSGLKWLQVVHPEDRMRWLAIVDEITNDMAEFESRIRGADGNYRWFLVRGERVQSLPYEPELWAGTCTPIDALHGSYERRLKELEQEKQRTDRFIAMLSHELRTPLAAIQSALDVIALENLSADATASIELARRNLQLESSILNDLLELARMRRDKLRLELSLVDLHVLLLDVLDICRADAARKRIQLIPAFDAAHHQIIGDTTRLQQIFWNILKNAIQHTPPGGEIRIRTISDQQQIAVEIQDSGIGLEQEDLATIAALLDQQQEHWPSMTDGLGLGLSICASLAARHNGTITASSDGIGTGSLFVVTLPVDQYRTQNNPAQNNPAQTTPTQTTPARNNQPAPPAAAGPDHAPGSQAHRILVVDDNISMVTVYHQFLTHLGYHVTKAFSMTEALHICDGETFDLVITDIGLPDGNGIQLLQQLRQRMPVQAIAVSGYGTQEDKDRSIAAGFIAHLVKPFSIAELEKVIRRVMEEQG